MTRTEPLASDLFAFASVFTQRFALAAAPD